MKSGQRMKARQTEIGLTQAQLSIILANATKGVWNPTIQQVPYIETKRRVVNDIEIHVLARVHECKPVRLLEGEPAASDAETTE